MKSSIDKLINIAEAEVGYLEKKSNDCLGEKTANAGDKNFTIYGLAQGCNGQPWCDAFVDWCFIQAFGTVEANRLLCGFSNYTPTSASLFKTKGLYALTQAQRGDVIFFKNSQRICHTGIVYKVDATHIYTIEGNTNAGNTLISNGGGVAKKSYSVNYRAIAGFGRPDYSQDGMPFLYRGCIGVPVKKLQKILNTRFPHGKLVEDGDFAAKTLNKLIESQALLGLSKTGVTDVDTWSALNG